MNYKISALTIFLSFGGAFSASYCTQDSYINIDGFIGQPPLKVCWLTKRFINSQTLPKNVLLLYGPPGNGKTTLAQKIAELSDSTFLTQPAPSIVDSYIGSGSKRIGSLFEYADLLTQDDKKVVIFIDEIDAIASNNQTEFRSEHKLSLQQLWLELDKCKNNHNMLIIFATNHFTTLDRTFLDRLGGNTFEIKNPDASKRREILNHYLEKANISMDHKPLETLVKETDGLSIRSLEDMVNDIQMTSEVSNNNLVTNCIIADALMQTKSKFQKNTSGQDQERKLEKIHTWISIIGGVLGIMVNSHHMWDIASRALEN